MGADLTGLLPVTAQLAVAAAARRPPGRGHLHHHPPPAVLTEPRRLELAPSLAPGVRARLPAQRAVGRAHSVALSALIGISSSSNNSMSRWAGRPRVVR